MFPFPFRPRIAAVVAALLPCAVLFSTVAVAQSSPPVPLAQVVDTMIARNAKRAQELRSYQGMRRYSVQYHAFFRTYHAGLVARVVYHASGTREFTILSQSGSGFLVHRVLQRLIRTEEQADQARNRKNVDLDRQNYSFSDVQWSPAEDGCSYSASVRPRRADPLLYRGRIWMDEHDFAVCRMQVEPSQRPSFWIKSTRITQLYHKVGRFWLPEKNESVSKIRLGGTAVLRIANFDQKILKAVPQAD